MGVVKLRGVGVYLFGSSVWQVQLSLRTVKTVSQTCRCRCASHSLLAYRLKIHGPKTVYCTINCKRRWNLLKKNIHKGDNCVNDGKNLNGCDMFKVKQMIVVYDDFFFWRRSTAVWGYDMLVYVIISCTTEESALLKLGSEYRTVIGKVTVVRSHETCFIFIG